MTEQIFNAAHEPVRKLVADFRQHEAHYLSAKYQEQDVRRDFIDKFWIALGWDVYREQQTNPYEQDVKVEKNVEVKGRIKKADYAFLAANFRDVRFFVEAKKPARNIDNPDDYFQTIRYGWNAQAPLSVLTDFEQFRVLDCRYKPDIQTALHRAVKKFHYTEYADADRFAEIYHLFSREAVLGGSLERYAAGLEKPKGRAAQRGQSGGGYKSVDEDFLRELDELREELARSFKNRNSELNGEELTEATQRTIDRLVFMRFLEDKLIEPEVMVERLGERGTAWGDFVGQSQRLNRIYNGIIFRHHDIIDDPAFVVDERVFAGVRERLAHTNSPYDFNSLPVHILGSIYERFLGKVITTTDKRAKVVDKPEVRKAGGVYYTPEYVVRYIVEQTVGKLVAGKTPEQVAGMRFADIACGSGSFLLGVYDVLLRHHAAFYNEPENRRKALKAGCIEAEGGALRLSLRQRKSILLNNIYGVDLDAQAVEVAQLSLFLKLLEDETTASAAGHQLEFRETMLPSLEKNIVHGNSLIGWDIGGGLFGDEEEHKLFPMDFAQQFPEVIGRGGFDAIVGNPPYGALFTDAEKKYIRESFRSYKYKYDSYIYFIEKALKITKGGGYVSFITPEVWLKLENCKPLRELIAKNANFKQLLVCGENVFSQAVVNTIVFVLCAGVPQKNIRIEKADDSWEISGESWKASENLAVDYRFKPEILPVINRMKALNIFPLSHFGEAIQGITPYDKYRGQDPELIKRRGYHAQSKLDRTYGKWLAGMDIARYEHRWSGEWLSYGPWLGAPREPRFFEAQRLLFREIPGERKRIQATLVEETFYHGHSITPFKLHEASPTDLRYLLGLANSTLITWYGRLTLSNFGKDIFPKLNPQDIKALPIRTIDFSDKADRARHDRVVSLVEQMLASKRQLQQARTDRDRHHYENKCAALDRQIDQLVYELYDLTPEEIAVVEAGEQR